MIGRRKYSTAEFKVIRFLLGGTRVLALSDRARECTRGSCCSRRTIFTVALPFCHLELRAARRKPATYPKQINSLGDHIRARRLDLNLLQKQVADQIEFTNRPLPAGNATQPSPRSVTCRQSFSSWGTTPYLRPAHFLNALLPHGGRLAYRSGRWLRSWVLIRRR